MPFGERDVCVIDASAFLAQWHHLFGPGRDDVFVLHNSTRKVFFHVHEDVLEVGERRF